MAGLVTCMVTSCGYSLSSAYGTTCFTEKTALIRLVTVLLFFLKF